MYVVSNFGFDLEIRAIQAKPTQEISIYFTLVTHCRPTSRQRQSHLKKHSRCWYDFDMWMGC